jgi:hypothetical protein
MRSFLAFGGFSVQNRVQQAGLWVRHQARENLEGAPAEGASLVTINIRHE